MSCRAFSRRIEHQCLERLFQRFDMNTIVCEFRMTERNGPARDFFESVGGIEKDGAMILTRAEFGRHCPRLFHEVTEVGDGS
jgi:predicted enzyme involved in methoxymalonyl-ACP biosynthesis